MIFQRATLCALTVLIMSAGCSAAADHVMERRANNKLSFQFANADGPDSTKSAIIGYELRVTGPGGYSSSSSFDPGADIVFSSSSVEEDGLFKWQLMEVAESKKDAHVATTEELVSNGRNPDDTSIESTSTKSISGAFSILNGVIIDPNTAEMGDADLSAASDFTPTTLRGNAGHERAQEDGDGAGRRLDQVVLDDQIVAGSSCVGQDCVNGESFGFDTMRLKENNLRIHFDDTSTSASFPRNDWRIIINDSANGGNQYFAIEDATAGRMPFLVEAGAPKYSLYVEKSGYVGFGTQDPLTQLHSKDGNTPALRLEQDGSSGFTPQTWDVAGNEASFFIRDATNSQLPFRIQPGADTNSLVIANDNKIGLGTFSPQEKLHVKDGNTPTLRLEQVGSSTTQTWDVAGDEVSFFIRDATNSQLPFQIRPGADTNSLVIADNNKIGLGTFSPQEKLHVKDDVHPKIHLDGPNNIKTCDIDCSLVNWRRAGVTDVVAGQNPVQITFSQPLPDTNYVVSLTAVGSTGTVTLAENSLTNGGFSVHTGNSTSAVMWVTHPII